MDDARPLTPCSPGTPPGPVAGIHDTQPALHWEDAFLSGNGEVGIMVLGGPGRERVVHNHHRFVLPDDARGLGPPRTADRLEEVRDLILAGRRREAQRLFSDGRSLAWTQAFHPGPVLHLDAAPIDGGGPGDGDRDVGGGLRGPVSAVPPDYRRRTRFTTGEVITTWSAGRTAYRHRAFVSRTDRVTVHEVTGDDLELTLRLSADTPGVPADLSVTASAQATRLHEAALTVLATYPPTRTPTHPPTQAGGEAEGFLGVTRVVADGGAVEVAADGVRVRGARRVQLLTHVGRWRGRAGLRSALAELEAMAADYEALLDRHATVHGELFARCALDLDAAPAHRDLPVAALVARAGAGVLDPALVETLFASGRYLLLSSCGVLPPRLTGLWLGAWGAAWSGDLTTDANLNLQVAAVTITGMPELLEGYVTMIADQLDDWRLNARSIYGARGVLAPSRTDGEHGRLFHLDDDWPWAMWLAGADWLLAPLVEHWRCSGDDGFLAVLAPWLAEVAMFFEDVLTRTDGEGRLVLVPSYSPEVGPLDEDGGPGDGGAAAVNATMDLAAARHALVTAADAVERLGGDPDAVRRWRALADRLPPYRVDARGRLAEWAWPGLETPADHRHVSHLYPVWPLHEITPDDTPALADAAVAALLARGDEDLSAHGSLHRALAAARLKRADLARTNLLKVLDGGMLFRSLMTSHNPGLRIYNADGAHALPAAVVELLLDSRPGVVELLPALPGEWVTGRLRGSPTRAGVRVGDLVWDLRQGWVRVTLHAARPGRIELVCRLAREGEVRRQVEVPAGRPLTLAVALRPLP